MCISLIQLWFPINIILEYLLIHQTKRKPSEISLDKINELLLFCNIIIWMKMFHDYSGEKNECIPF